MKKLFILVVLTCMSNILYGQAPESFHEGRWHSTKGEVFEGLISFQMPTNYPVIYYKKNAHDKPMKVKAPKIKGFVVGSDTFATVYDFTVEGVSNPQIRVGSGIARVVEVGKIHLYELQYLEMYTPGSYGDSGILMEKNGIKVYIVRDESSDDFISVRESQASFNRQMAKMLQANAELVARIDNYEYSILKVRQLIQDFNAWHAGR